MNKYRVISLFFILSGILINEATIKFLSSNETKFNTIEKSLILLLFEILLILIGIYIAIKKKKAVQNIILTTSSFLFLIVLIEILLSFSVFQNLTSDHPLWIPYKYKKISNNYNQLHAQFALKNRYGFNDINHSYNKANNLKQIRIAVLGDSFIWGYGAVDTVIWTRKLKKIFIKNEIDCTILNWGKSGWSTLDQFNFLTQEGVKYKFDYLIFAFVVNDPVMDSSFQKLVIYPNGFIDSKILNPLACIIPNTISFSTDLINNFFSTHLNYGYFNWLVNNVYTENNLKKYSILLHEIKKYCQERKILFSFVMTPENYSPILEKYFNLIISPFDENDIPYHNLFPYVKNNLGKYSIRDLWANPSDGHPGNLVTDIYAQYTFEYLKAESKGFHMLGINR